MLYVHPFQSEWLVAAHREELTTAAEIHRLRAPHRRRRRVVLGHIGGLLIRTGERLLPPESVPTILPRSG